MNKQTNNIDEKELLKRIEDLIDNKTSNQKFADSFLGFCSRLFSVRPKTDVSFRLSLKRGLLKKHPAYFEKEVESRNDDRNYNLTIRKIIMEKLNTMNKIKRFALVGVPALVIVFAFLFTTVISPQIQTAKAMEVMASDPQVRAVIEEYNLEVQEVIIKGDTAYIILDNVDRSNVIVTVDLNNGTVGKVVKKNGDGTKVEAFEEKAAAMGLTVEELKASMIEQYEAKAESIGMTVEEFKEYLINQKKSGDKAFEEKAEASGMTLKEYKDYLVEQYNQKAEAMGMTVGEFKNWLAEQKKAQYEDLEAEAEAKEMTIEEYKAYLGSQKK